MQLRYAAPGTRDGWQSFLDALRNVLNGSAANFSAHLPQPRRAVAPGFDAAPRGALRLHRRLAAAEIGAGHVTDTLDLLRHSGVLLTGAGRILLTNRAVSTMLGTGDGVSSDAVAGGPANGSLALTSAEGTFW